MTLMKTRKEFAETIMSLSYGDLRSVAVSLVAMNEDPEIRKLRDIDTIDGMAQLLWDWAEAQVDE